MQRGSATAERIAADAGAMRKRLIARIHVGRKELVLVEDSYRAILARITGQDSSAKLSVKQLRDVVAEFERLGLKSPRKPSGKPHVRKVFALWKAMAPHLRDPSREALRSFVSRQTGVADPEWLSPAQANKVTEALKAWAKRMEAGDAG